MIKYLMNDSSPVVKFNTETEEVDIVRTSREAIRCIVMVDEPGIMIDENGHEVNVKSGDIIVRFYETIFPKRAIVVKSKDWKDNIKAYNKKEQEDKEKWALNKCCDEGPCCCDESKN